MRYAWTSLLTSVYDSFNNQTHHAEELQKALKVRDAGGKADNNPQLIEQAVKKFNVHPGKGLDFLISSGYRNTPKVPISVCTRYEPSWRG